MFIATYVDNQDKRHKVSVPTLNRESAARWMFLNYPGVYMFRLSKARPSRRARAALMVAMDETGTGAHRPARRR
jgi:hypothetical protein